MANTYTLINSYTATGSVANIDFTSIPSTYTDLLVKTSLRGSTNNNIDMLLQFNGVTTNYNFRWISGDGSSAGSATGAGSNGGLMTMNNDTANTFSNVEIYIPNYLSSNYKSVSFDAVTENNATAAYAILGSQLWSNTAAITSVKLLPSPGNFVQYSTAYLYGIKNS